MQPSTHERTARRTRLRVEQLEDRCLLAAYAIVDLGTLGGESGESYAYSINEHGQVVGESTASDNKTHPFVWTPRSPDGLNGTMTDLGLLPDSTYTTARDINEHGQIVGYSNNRGFVWDGQMTVLEPSAGKKSSRAFAINDQGKVVGWSGDTYYISGRAALWQRGTIPIELATIGTVYSKAIDISNNGQIVGLIAGHPPNSYGGAYWTLGFPTLIGELATWGSDVRGVNDKGQIVGISHISDGSWILARPYLYRVNGSMRDLGTLECGAGAKAFGIANGINIHTQIVGYQGCVQGGTFNTTQGAALWDSINGWRDLHELIPPGSGWDLVSATAVSNRGHIIGFGFKESDINTYRAFLLVPDHGRAHIPPPINVIDVQALGADVAPLSSNRRPTEAIVHHRSAEVEPTAARRHASLIPNGFTHSGLSNDITGFEEIDSEGVWIIFAFQS